MIIIMIVIISKIKRISNVYDTDTHSTFFSALTHFMNELRILTIRNGDL